MCYSPEADLIAGLVVGVVAVDAIRHAERRDDLALAAVPAVLAVHQLIEAAAWWSLQGKLSTETGDLAVAGYLTIALCVVPLLVPYAVLRSEVAAKRRVLMKPFVALGGAVSIVMAATLLLHPFSASTGGRYIAYDVATIGGGVTGVAYAAAVCVPLLLSSHRRLVAFGMVNVVVAAGLSYLMASGLISLWCVWAAVTSIVIAAHVRRLDRPWGSRLFQVGSADS